MLALTTMMICGAAWVQWRPFSRLKVLCASSPSEVAEELRQQLDCLLEEEDATRSKASSSRLRLMRLSEAVEKLRIQAAVSVRKGAEDAAREALFQKRKVMQVMEKLKSRIETLDALSTKLNEAISIKESLLIQNMALDLDVSEAEAPSTVRIVSPAENDTNSTDNDLQAHQMDTIFTDDQESDTSIEDSYNHETQRRWNDADAVTEFMEHLDQQLKTIEEEVVIFLKLSTNREKEELPDTLITTEILQGILHLRERIAACKEKTQA